MNFLVSSSCAAHLKNPVGMSEGGLDCSPPFHQSKTTREGPQTSSQPQGVTVLGAVLLDATGTAEHGHGL